VWAPLRPVRAAKPTSDLALGVAASTTGMDARRRASGSESQALRKPDLTLLSAGLIEMEQSGPAVAPSPKQRSEPAIAWAGKRYHCRQSRPRYGVEQ
jgi:hypothetical protein